MNRNCAIRPSRLVWGTGDIFSEFVLDLIDSQKEYRPNQVSWIFSKILMASDLLLMVGYFLLSCSCFESWWRHQMEKNRHWPFVRGIHRSPVNFPHKGQWHGSLVFFYLCPNKHLSKQPKRRWFETPSRSLWRYCNDALSSHTRFV